MLLSERDVLIHQLRGLLWLTRDHGGQDHLVLVRVLLLPAGGLDPHARSCPPSVRATTGPRAPGRTARCASSAPSWMWNSRLICMREPQHQVLGGIDLFEHLHVLRGRALRREPDEAGLEDPPQLEPLEHGVDTERRPPGAGGRPWNSTARGPPLGAAPRAPKRARSRAHPRDRAVRAACSAPSSPSSISAANVVRM